MNIFFQIKIVLVYLMEYITIHAMTEIHSYIALVKMRYLALIVINIFPTIIHIAKDDLN